MSAMFLKQIVLLSWSNLEITLSKQLQQRMLICDIGVIGIDIDIKT